MWLDRLSSQQHASRSPEPPSSRTIASIPRRQSNLAPTPSTPRPGFNPRSSSLSVSAAESTTSLLSSRKPKGSATRSPNTNGDVTDPLAILGKLLGQEGQGSASRSNGHDALEEDGLELDFGGLNLYEFALAERPEDSLFGNQTIQEYETDKKKFEELHQSIRACDEVLNSVEVNLTSFRNDLAAVSAEIETLQSRSTALNVRLDNRKVVENGLGPVVEEISVSPAAARKIVDGVIDEAWVRALAEVEKRSKAMEAKSKEHENVKAVNDLKPLLEDLINKALERIRDFLVAQIKALRSPNINAQIIQQQHFVRYKDLYAFMHRHHRQLAEEIGQAYINTMRWYFLNQFTRYEKALEKSKLHVLDKYNVLGHDDGSRKTNILTASKSSTAPHDAYSLGRRIDLLKTTNQSALPSFLAEEDKQSHYLEFPFRNFNLALIDNASAEYSFLTSFFSPALSYSAITRHFDHIFEPTFALGQSLTKSLTGETFDCLGILLCVRINQHFAFELQRRKIPAVDGYVNGTSMLLWPRFQKVMDQHCESVRSLTNGIPSRKPSAAEAAKQSAAPHFVTQRFGQFMQGVLALSEEAGDDEPVSTSLLRLRAEVEAFLTKMSKSMADSRKTERFLYNNYSLILTIVGDMNGKLAIEQQEHFEALKRAFEKGA